MTVVTSKTRGVLLALSLPGLSLGILALVRDVAQWPLGYRPVLFVMVVVVPPMLLGLAATPLAFVGRRRDVALGPSAWTTALGLWVGAAGWLAGTTSILAPMWPTRFMSEAQMSPPVDQLMYGPGRLATLGGTDGSLTFDLSDGRSAKWNVPVGQTDVAWTWHAVEHRLLVVDCGGSAMVVRSIAADGKSHEVYRVAESMLDAIHIGACTCAVLADAERVACSGVLRVDPSVPPRTFLLEHAFTDPTPLASHEVLDTHGPSAVRFSTDGARAYFSETCGPNREQLCVYAVSPDGAHKTELNLGQTNLCSFWPQADGRLGFVTTADERCEELSVVDGELASMPKSVVRLRDAPDHASDSQQGIDGVAWSPDGASVALVSDHEGPGCAGSEGVSSCSGMLFLVDTATSRVRRVSPLYVASRVVVFTP
jgi:hypothetical protein